MDLKWPTRDARRSRIRLALPPLSLSLCLAALIGCATTGRQAPSLLPTAHQVKTGPFVIYSNAPIDADSPSVRALDSLRNDLAATMDCRDENDADPIEIYVLDDRAAFLHLLRYYFPELPPRRAFFLARGPERMVYTYNGPMLEEDLRHEAAHALLRGRFGEVPLWLDEGLAEYFEVGPGDPRDRRNRLDRLAADLKTGWSPNLERLESLADVHQMSPRDYREAWAWVDLLLDGPSPKPTTLVDFLDRRRGAVEPEPLSGILKATGTNGATLLAHLGAEPSSIAARKSATAEDQERLIRFQDRAPEPSPAPHRRVGFFRRVASFLGL